MDTRLIFLDYYQFINEVTHPSSFRELLDFCICVESVLQANPQNISSRHEWSLVFVPDNENEQGARKNLYIVHITLGVLFSQSKKSKGKSKKDRVATRHANTFSALGGSALG